MSFLLSMFHSPFALEESVLREPNVRTSLPATPRVIFCLLNEKKDALGTKALNNIDGECNLI